MNKILFHQHFDSIKFKLYQCVRLINLLTNLQLKVLSFTSIIKERHSIKMARSGNLFLTANHSA